MRFRPCIDIHNGQVKQIVGASLRDENATAKENFVSARSASDYARLYREHNLRGGHVILLNARTSELYEKTRAQAREALSAWPGGLMVGGGVTDENAAEWIAAGASHVIVTSFVFHDGQLDYERLKRLAETVDPRHIVLDLSCRKTEAGFSIMTDRWQKTANETVTCELLRSLEPWCDEYLIHATDVEGHQAGADEELLRLLASYEGRPVVYAGGIGTLSDLQRVRNLTQGRIDVTIGSAMAMFGGTLELEDVLSICDPA